MGHLVFDFLCCSAVLAMDCADTFNKRLEKLGLPALVQTQLKLREFTTAASPYCALSMGAEEAFEVILKDGSVEAGSAPNLLSTPTAGKLRRRPVSAFARSPES